MGFLPPFREVEERAGESRRALSTKAKTPQTFDFAISLSGSLPARSSRGERDAAWRN
jgi:hypothetical protein